MKMIATTTLLLTDPRPGSLDPQSTGKGKRRGEGEGEGEGAAGGARKKAKWLTAAIVTLAPAVEELGGVPGGKHSGRGEDVFWQKVADRIFEQSRQRFTGGQCQKKWKHVQAGPSLPWTPEQEEALKVLVRGMWDRDAKQQRQGFWNEVGALLARSGFHCNRKWTSLGSPLDGDIKTRPFTEDESKAIIAGKAAGDSWVKIGKALNRTEKSVESRWRKILSKR